MVDIVGIADTVSKGEHIVDGGIDIVNDDMLGDKSVLVSSDLILQLIL